MNWRTGAVRPAVDSRVMSAIRLFGHEGSPSTLARRQRWLAVPPRASRPRCSTQISTPQLARRIVRFLVFTAPCLKSRRLARRIVRFLTRIDRRTQIGRGPNAPLEATLPRPKWRPRSISVSIAGVQIETSLLDRLFGWISSDGSEKPNDPPGKPAGFVCNSEASRPPFAETLGSSSERSGHRRAALVGDRRICQKKVAWQERVNSIDLTSDGFYALTNL